MDFPYLKLGEYLQKHLDRQGLKKAEVARRLTVSRSTVTEWFQGKYPPRRNYLAPLSHILCCEIDDLIELGEYDEEQVDTQYKVYLDAMLHDLIGLVYQEITVGHSLQTAGFPHQALHHTRSWLWIIERRLEMEIPDFENNLGIIQELQTAALSLLSVLYGTLLEVSSRQDIVSDTLPYFRRMSRLASTLQLPSQQAYSHYMLANSKYVARQHPQSLDHLDKAISIDPAMATEPEVLRLQLLNLAYQGKKDAFLEYENKAQRVLEGEHFSNEDDRIMLLEALGRGGTFFQLPYTKQFFLDAEQEIQHQSQTRHVNPLRLVQVNRARLNGLVRSNDPDLDYAEEIASATLRSTRKYSYHRHTKTIRNLAWELGILSKLDKNL